MIANLLAALAGTTATPPLPEWMVGCWEQRSEERWTEECWSKPNAGIMFGFSRTGVGARLEWWETNQIVREQSLKDGGEISVAFWAAPGGTERTRFVWRPGDEPGLTFHNPANEYPQRIRYWRKGRDLLAEISMADGSKPQRWRYVPVED